MIGLGLIVVLGIAAQWLSWRLHLPAILLLLAFGFVAGPVGGWLHPDELFGDLLFPLVSISVAIILFEGGLSLRLRELRRLGAVVISLTTLGVLITWVLASVCAYVIAGLDFGPALLLGAILTVTGPTVIIPLLRQVRPTGRIGAIVKWEGIVNDPIGALLAVIVFEVILAGGLGQGGGWVVLPTVLKAIGLGGLIGLAGATIMVLFLRRYIVPDFLQNPVSLMIVVMAYLASDMIQAESGLVAVTVMGIALANQRFVSIRHILEFKENLRVLLISSLFVILSARLSFDEMGLADIRAWLFVLALILLVRPASAILSTLRSKLTWNERLFVAWMAPRGVVAAAVVSVFVLRLDEAGIRHFDVLVSVVFQVIIGTVAVYGLTAAPVARRLKLSKPNPQGVLFAGAHPWAQDIAKALKERGQQVAMVDSNWANVSSARHNGIQAYYGSILSEDVLGELQLDGIGRLVAMTPNDEVNSLAALHFVELFGRSGVYQLPPEGSDTDDRRSKIPMHLQGRYLFHKKATFDYLDNRFKNGAVVKRHTFTEEFSLERLQEKYGKEALPIAVINEAGGLKLWAATDPPSPDEGDMVLSIVNPSEEKPSPGDTLKKARKS
jgi:NhaP-type Na+/H+ or K+/H+ antiporter